MLESAFPYQTPHAHAHAKLLSWVRVTVREQPRLSQLENSRLSQLENRSATPWTLAPRLFCPWDSPVKNPGVGCHALLQGIFPAEGVNQVSCVAGGSLLSEPPGKLHMLAPYFL